MRKTPYIGPKREFAVEILTLTVPTVVAVVLADLSIGLSIFLVVFVIAATSVIKYLAIFSPRIQYREEKLTTFFDRFLEIAVVDFEDRFQPAYDIRINVMRPQHKWVFSVDSGKIVRRKKYLQIAYHAGGGPKKSIAAHDSRRRDETQAEWGIKRPPEGNCGRAFVEQQTRVATRGSTSDTWDNQQTTGQQDTVTTEVNSILSVPVTRPDEENPVAVLNIDAPVSAAESNFDDREVKQAAEEYADLVGILL